jgi:rod shape-determining protein MreD
MRKNIWWAILVIAAALIQTTWLGAVRLQGVLPDLVILLVVYFAISEGEERAMFTGALGGIYQDVAGAGGTVLGHHVLCHVVVGYLVGRIAQRIIMDHPVIQVGLVMAASILDGILFTCIQYVQTPGMSAIRTILATVVPGAFYTSLVTPLVFLLLAWALRRSEGPVRGDAL